VGWAKSKFERHAENCFNQNFIVFAHNVLQSLSSWRKVFWLAASITMAGAIAFAVLASDQLQDWAEEKKCDQGGKTERA